MKAISRLKESDSTTSIETLHINFSKKQVKANINAIRFIDKDTEQHVIYLSSLDISAYGETLDKAKKMLQESINSCFQYFFSHSQKRVKDELAKLGWEQNHFFNKDFSRAYVDGNGELKNFNAIENSIEKVGLITT